MANLIKCKDCGHEVSKKATACPNCGAPVKKPAEKSGCGMLLVVGSAAFIVWLVAYEPSPPTSTSRPATPVSDGKLTYYAKDTVNIRRGPGTDHDVVDQLRKGQAWRCYPKDAESKWIKCAEDEYIHSSLLTTSPPPTAAPASTQAECKSKILAAEEAGIIVRYWADREGTHVAVDETTWKGMSYTTKLGLTATFECAIVGPGERLTAVYVHSDKTNTKLGKYRFDKLEVY